MLAYLSVCLCVVCSILCAGGRVECVVQEGIKVDKHVQHIQQKRHADDDDVDDTINAKKKTNCKPYRLWVRQSPVKAQLVFECS